MSQASSIISSTAGKNDVVPEVVDEFEDNKEDQDVDDSYMTDSPEKSDDEDEEDNYNYRDSSD